MVVDFQRLSRDLLQITATCSRPSSPQKCHSSKGILPKYPPWNQQFAPENGDPLEKEIPNLETTIFRGELT